MKKKNEYEQAGADAIAKQDEERKKAREAAAKAASTITGKKVKADSPSKKVTPERKAEIEKRRQQAKNRKK
tara:strand:- start:862 stop:1074 length:213 start_codon:yes stop_codon:yes gene_type:complete